MTALQRAPGRLRLGIVANEFFDSSVGDLGGFGWATRQVAQYFQSAPERGVDVVYLSRLRDREAPPERVIHDTRLITYRNRSLDYARRVRAERIDLLLSIDYRPSYRRLLRLLPRTPLLVWVRDPRTPDDVARVSSIRVPGQPGQVPQGLRPMECTSLAGVVRTSRLWRRPVLFATPAPSLAARVPATYGVAPREVTFLPNIIDLAPQPATARGRPSVVFVGRLDPYKRPWLFAELALHFPEVDFLFLGKAHFSGPGAWEPRGLPANARLLGHVGEARKAKLLSAAAVLVNTSLHEGLAVSFLEALACGTPLLASVDPEAVISRFGLRTAAFAGDGRAGLPGFVDALRRLLADAELRRRLGGEGRRWVTKTHTRESFVTAFEDLVDRARVRDPRRRQ
jgi:glycosyltransferase involved in cell wall biosynthesis